MSLWNLIPDAIRLRLSRYLARRKYYQDLMNERTNPYGLDFDSDAPGAAPVPEPIGKGPRPVAGQGALQIPVTQTELEEEAVPAMSFTDFCLAYWKAGYHPPYPIPPKAKTSAYRVVSHWLRVVDNVQDDYSRGFNVLLACYVYLAGKEDKEVKPREILGFLQQPWEQAFAHVAAYQPCYPFLLSAEAVLGTSEKDVFREQRIMGAFEYARSLAEGFLKSRVLALWPYAC